MERIWWPQSNYSWSVVEVSIFCGHWFLRREHGNFHWSTSCSRIHSRPHRRNLVMRAGSQQGLEGARYAPAQLPSCPSAPGLFVSVALQVLLTCTWPPAPAPSLLTSPPPLRLSTRTEVAQHICARYKRKVLQRDRHVPAGQKHSPPSLGYSSSIAWANHAFFERSNP